MYIPVELLETLKREECVLFVGSGLSRGLPDWKGLIKPLADELGIATEGDLRIIAEYYKNEFGRSKLEKSIISQLQKDVPLTNTHELLADLPFRAVVTTNYDHLLEKAFSRRNFIKIVDGREAPLARADQLPLIKMHGDLDDPSSMVITKTDYDKYAERHRALITYLLGFLISNNFLFVGFSLRDPNFDNIYVQMKSLFEKSQRKNYAIFKNPLKYEVKRLKSMRIEVISIREYGEIPETFEELAKICSEKIKMRTELSPLQLESIRSTFCKVVERQNRWLDPRGIFQFDRMLTKREVELEEVYVVPRLVKQEIVRKAKEEEKLEKDENIKEIVEEVIRRIKKEKKGILEKDEIEEYFFEKQVEITIKEAISNPKNKHIVILGDPAIGKTCLLRYIALKVSTATDEILGVGKSLFPVLIPLREYPKYGKNEMLKEFVFHYIRSQICSLSEDVLEYILERNSFFFLLDGLDEVVLESQRIEVSRQVERFMAQYPDTRIILTSRPAGYRAAALVGTVPHFTLSEFNDNEIKDFLMKWFTFLEKIEEERFNKARVEKKTNELANVILGRGRILRLARNPLLLTILVLVHRVGRKLPERRAEFYEYAVRTIAGSWESWKSLQTDRKIPNQETILTILEKVGFKLHNEKQENVVGIEELRTWLNEAIEEEMGFSSRKEVIDFIWMLNERAGLLVERGLGLYGFVHLTFQEYFAARHIACGRGTDLAQNLIKKHLYSSRWREVFLLAVAIAPPEKANIIFECVLKTENAFEKYIHSNLIFAGLMLADIPRIDNLRRKIVINDLIFLATSRDVDLLRIEALEVLTEICRAFSLGDFTWALKLLSDKCSDIRRQALEYFTVGGAKDSRIQDAIFGLLHDKDPGVCHQAMVYFTTIGAKDPRILNRISGLLHNEDPYIRHQAMVYFTTIGAKDTRIQDKFFKMLDSRRSSTRHQAMEYFTTIGVKDSRIQDKFFKMLDDEHLDICRESLKYFITIGQKDLKIQNKVFGLLSNRNPDIRQQALEYFTVIEARDCNIQEKTFHLLSDIHPDVRQQALQYFTIIEARDPEIQDNAFHLLSDKYPDIRQQVFEYFVTVGSKDPKIQDAIFGLLHDEDSDIRQQVFEYLTTVGAKDTRIQDKFFKMLDSRRSSDRDKALQYFTIIEARDSEIQDKALQLISDSKGYIRQKALEYLTTVGSRDPRIQDKFFKMLDDEDPDIRQQALKYFTVIEARDPKIQDEIFKLLWDGNSSNCCQALQYFAIIEARDSEIQDKALQLINDKGGYIRQKALEYLTTVGAKDSRIQDKFFNMLDDKSRDIRQQALEYFTVIEARDLRIQKKAVDLLNDRNSNIQRQALEYFTVIEARDLRIQKKIVDLLNNWDSNVRQKALEYLITFKARDPEIQKKAISLIGYNSHSLPQNEKIQDIVIEYLLRCAREESLSKASVLFTSGDKPTRRGAYKLMKALLHSEERNRAIF